MQDQPCRDFLLQIGLNDFIMAVDAQFSNVHFFLVSATGGVERGIAFNPDSTLLNPFLWIMRQENANLLKHWIFKPTLSKKQRLVIRTCPYGADYA